jgi:Fe2+ or Zn2+ uptake regulation protein
MNTAGHATNTSIHKELTKTYPDLSATTVHRATSRLAARGVLAIAPPDTNGSIRYDITTHAHDHFMCEKCGVLKDAYLGHTVRSNIEKSIGSDCTISGRLTVGGLCKSCTAK